MSSSLSAEQLAILRHTASRAANGRYRGGSPAMRELVALGLMRPCGWPSWCSDEFCMTSAGSDALHAAEKQASLEPIKKEVMAGISAENKERYVASGGDHCPFCRCDDIGRVRLDASDLEAWAVVRCSRCGGEWHDVYTLTGVEAMRKPEEDQQKIGQRSLCVHCGQLIERQWLPRRNPPGVPEEVQLTDEAITELGGSDSGWRHLAGSNPVLRCSGGLHRAAPNPLVVTHV